MAIFSQFRRLRAAAEQIADALTDLAKLQREAGPALDRIDALELSRHQFEAECNGKLLQADGKLKAASNAEARERALKKSYDRQIDEFEPRDPGGEEGAPPVLSVDVEGGEAERLRAMRLVVAPGPKAAAIAAKWAG